MKNKRLYNLVSVMLLCVMLVTTAVFAEGETPDGESRTDAIQTTEQSTDVQSEVSSDTEQTAGTTEATETEDTVEPDKAYDEIADDDDDDDDDDPDVDPSVRTVQKKGTFFTWTDLTIKINSYGVVISQPLDADMGPVQTRIKAAAASITVSWDKAADSSITGYILLRAGKDGKYTQLAILDAGTTT